MTKKGQHITAVWQNGGFSAKFNGNTSIELLCKGWADVFQMPHLHKAPARQAVKKVRFLRKPDFLAAYISLWRLYFRF